MQNRILNLVSSVPVYQSESLSASQSIAAAHVKSNAQTLIQAVTNYLTNDKEQQRRSHDLQTDSKVEEPQVYYVPVLIDEVNTDTRTASVQVKDNPSLRANIGNDAYQLIAQAVNATLPTLQWKTGDESCINLINAYLGMVEQSDLPDRIKEKMLTMFNDRISTL